MKKYRQRTLILLASAFSFAWLSSYAAEVVQLEAPSSSMVQVRIMIKAGSAHDPAGKEGLAAFTAQAVLEGGYGDPADPVTKEELAWNILELGRAAEPGWRLDKETTTFSMTVPTSELKRYLENVLGPLFTEPVFLAKEIERIRNENLTYIQGRLRLSSVEVLGLEAMDNYLFEGTSYGHPDEGTVQGVKSIARDDLLAFYKTYYSLDNIILGVGGANTSVHALAVLDALSGLGDREDVAVLEEVELAPPSAVEGRHLRIVGMEGAKDNGSGIHAAYPLDLTRVGKDFWPLYVANVHFGTHRDSFGHLYDTIRRQRGHNYGDYSYVEHFADRPFNLFPPFNTPRRYQYVNLWIRPVVNQFTHNILKAMVWEFENFIRRGMTEEEVAAARIKARGLYLNLAENLGRMLQAKMDDAFYGLNPGYLEGYLDRVSHVTTEEVNAAIRKYFQAKNLKIVVVTDENRAEALKTDIVMDQNALGKSPHDYRMDSTLVITPTQIDSTFSSLPRYQKRKRVIAVDTVKTDTTVYYNMYKEDLAKLQRDAVWQHYWLDLSSIGVVSADALFETGDFITLPKAAIER